MMPIIDLLWNNFDKLKRNEDSTIVYDNQLKEITENLLNLESLDSTLYHTYDEFFNAVTNGTVAYDRQQRNLPDNASSIISDLTNVSTERRISEFRKLNESLYNSKMYIPEPERNIFSLPKGCKSKYRYVSDVLIREIWQFWRPGEKVFISAGTGRGKNTFIKEELLKHCGNQKVVIFENRQSLMQQQINDIISEIHPDFLKYKDISDDNMIVFGQGKNRNIMIISYQCAALKCMYNDSDFLNFCLQARYLIFDEAHYILDDSHFNKGINFVAQAFLGKNFMNATKIFMSGTMEEIYEYVQRIDKFSGSPLYITDNKFLEENLAYGMLRDFDSNLKLNYVLSLPTDYSYIQPYKYKKIDDICSKIAQTSIYEKWLIFVKSIEEGASLKSCLQGICNGSVCFLSAENKTENENKEIYNQLIHKCSFECRVLIATTVIYNGINVKDDAVKHIVVPFTSMSVAKQLLGRKRVSENETVNVYFPDVNYGQVKKRYRDCIKDCMEIISLNANLQGSALCQLNGLINSLPSKYYYLSPPNDFYINYTGIQYINVLFNFPAIYKLYYDTCFYIFVLHRLKETKDDFLKILFKHLDIEDKYSDVVDISIQTKEEKESTTIKELVDYFESLADTEIVVPDDNGSYEEFLKLKEIINNAYKNLHGENFDTQWKNKERFFSEEKIKTFLSELNLPYEIKSEGSKSKRTTMIKKITL